MPWVRFTRDFDWKPKPAVTVAYRAGTTVNVTRACAAQAIERGRAVAASRKRRAVSDASNEDPRAGEVGPEAEADAGAGEGSNPGSSGEVG